MVISRERAEDATDWAYGRPWVLIRLGMDLSQASISSKVSDPICLPWNPARMWNSTRYL
jgi:hypothetical protein